MPLRKPRPTKDNKPCYVRLDVDPPPHIPSGTAEISPPGSRAQTSRRYYARHPVEPRAPEPIAVNSNAGPSQPSHRVPAGPATGNAYPVGSTMVIEASIQAPFGQSQPLTSRYHAFSDGRTSSEQCPVSGHSRHSRPSSDGSGITRQNARRGRSLDGRHESYQQQKEGPRTSDECSSASAGENYPVQGHGQLQEPTSLCHARHHSLPKTAAHPGNCAIPQIILTPDDTPPNTEVSLLHHEALAHHLLSPPAPCSPRRPCSEQIHSGSTFPRFADTRGHDEMRPASVGPIPGDLYSPAVGGFRSTAPAQRNAISKRLRIKRYWRKLKDGLPFHPRRNYGRVEVS